MRAKIPIVGILIPAHNEEANIRHTIRMIQESWVVAPIFVVDDGSTDKTADIAEKMGVTVIRLPRNQGKAAAFFAGVRFCMRKNISGIVTLDADLVKMDSRELEKLIETVRETCVNKKIAMVRVGVMEEGFPFVVNELSGTRGFSQRALVRLTSKNVRKIPEGYGLEHALNYFIPYSYHIEWNGKFLYKKHGRNEGDRDKQYRDRTHTQHKLYQFGMSTSFKERKKKRVTYKRDSPYLNRRARNHNL